LIDSQICRFDLKVTYVVEQLTPQEMNDLQPVSFDTGDGTICLINLMKLYNLC
jgi:hypothetical protein